MSLSELSARDSPGVILSGLHSRRREESALWRGAPGHVRRRLENSIAEGCGIAERGQLSRAKPRPAAGRVPPLLAPRSFVISAGLTLIQN